MGIPQEAPPNTNILRKLLVDLQFISKYAFKWNALPFMDNLFTVFTDFPPDLKYLLDIFYTFIHVSADFNSKVGSKYKFT